MFRSRNFIIGLGLGFILSSLIFIILPSPSEHQSSQKTNEQSLKEIRMAAETYGYQLYTNEEIEQLKQNKLSNDKNETLEEKPIDTNFTIEKGMSSEEVTEILYKQKIIQNKEQFTQILEQYNLFKEIRAGDYVYSTGMTVEDLIALITNTEKEKWRKSS